MTADELGSGHADTEAMGIGQTVDEAVIDAVLAANRRSHGGFGVQAEVVAWGVHAIGIGGSCSFWAKVRKGMPGSDAAPEAA